VFRGSGVRGIELGLVHPVVLLGVANVRNGRATRVSSGQIQSKRASNSVIRVADRALRRGLRSPAVEPGADDSAVDRIDELGHAGSGGRPNRPANEIDIDLILSSLVCLNLGPHVKLKAERPEIMRFGRIILAILAPLVSLSALKTDLAAAGNTARADSLTSLLRAAAPMAAVYSAENQHVARSHTGQGASPVFRSAAAINPAAIWLPATEAALRLLTRQRNHVQLRC